MLQLGVPLGDRSSRYAQLYSTHFLPHYQSGEVVSFVGHGGRRIHALAFPHPREVASLVLLPGRTESHHKYAETLFDLHQAGVSVYTLDHRGQGYSERLSKDSELGHVESFDDYVVDLAALMENVVAKRAGPDLFLMAHSMGAAIASSYVLRHSPPLRGIVFSSPMLRIRFGGLPNWLVHGMVRLRCALGWGERSVVNERLDVESYGADLTRCDVRLAHYRSLLRDHPTLRLGPPSNRWMLSALEATAPLLRPKALHKFTCPVLVLEAGADSVLDVSANRAFDGLGEWTLRARFPDAFHDLFIERDAIRKKALTILFLFLRENATHAQRTSAP
jgi:lysophospholipase